jgi:HK97 family phage portal protein
LNLIAKQGTGKNAERMDRHPALDLLNRPTSWQSRCEWEKQVILYLLLSGNAYYLMIGGKKPQSLPLLHPNVTTVEPGKFGGPIAYGYDGTDRYLAEDVVHIRLTSWQDGPQGLLGEGLIRALHHDLNADRAASKLVATQAKQGRPPAVISPKNGAQWGDPDSRKGIAQAYARLLNEGAPAIVLSDEANIEFPTYNARDMEFQEARLFTRESILAAFGVPPTRVGLPTANYATSQQQDLIYWRNLQSLAALIDYGYTRVAERFERNIGIYHDFSEVPALQESRTSRLDRVATWVMLGSGAASAASYEGFHDAPVEDEEEVTEETPKETPDESMSLESFFRSAPPVESDERARLWKDWQERVHAPQERKLQRAMAQYLASQAGRIVGRFTEDLLNGRAVGELVQRQFVQRDWLGDLIQILLPAEEDAALKAALEDVIRGTLQAGFTDTRRQMGLSFAYEPVRRNTSAEMLIGSLITAVQQTTKDAVKATIQTGLDEGATIAQLQAKIMAMPQFGASRALAVARTETTRALSAGTSDAYQQALNTGVTFKQQWLSSRDSHVRDAHLALDGQERAIGEAFVVPFGKYAGQSALYPGGFTKAALVVNCRCTTIPVLPEE